MSSKTPKLKFIDLFAGIGGIRKGFEMACYDSGIQAECVFTSEIKPAAIKVLLQNNPKDTINGDICTIESSQIPEFDILLAGFPCQAFSYAGKRLGFMDTRGTLFFEVERILKDHKPRGFILENVEGLVSHDKTDKTKPIGRTLETILQHLKDIGYKVDWRLLNSKDFGIAQDRKRIYIVGSLTDSISLDGFEIKHTKLYEVLEQGLPTSNSPFVKNVLSHFAVEQLAGKSIKDKRGGDNNIHSWDLELKGTVSQEQKHLLNKLFKERRKKHWAIENGIDWMDGMALSLKQIQTFFDSPDLKEILEDLVIKGYLKKEYPKRLTTDLFGNTFRQQDPSLPVGYNIVAGKMSYEVAKILDPNDVAPTLVAMDMERLYVIDGSGLRPLTLREGLRLFGYPEDFKFDIDTKDGYDLLGNTVAVPVIKQVALRLLNKINQ